MQGKGRSSPDLASLQIIKPMQCSFYDLDTLMKPQGRNKLPASVKSKFLLAGISKCASFYHELRSEGKEKEVGPYILTFSLSLKCRY